MCEHIFTDALLIHPLTRVVAFSPHVEATQGAHTKTREYIIREVNFYICTVEPQHAKRSYAQHMPKPLPWSPNSFLRRQNVKFHPEP